MGLMGLTILTPTSAYGHRQSITFLFDDVGTGPNATQDVTQKVLHTTHFRLILGCLISSACRAFGHKAHWG